MTRFPPSVVKTSYVFEKLSELWDTMWRTWDLASVLTRYYPGFGVSNNSGASTISNFRIRSLWAQLSVDKRTSGPFSLEKGNYLYRYYCVMDPICWCPEKQAAQCKRAVCTQWRGSAFCHRNVVSGGIKIKYEVRDKDDTREECVESQTWQRPDTVCR